MIDLWEFFCPYERTPRRERRLHKSDNVVAICWEARHQSPSLSPSDVFFDAVPYHANRLLHWLRLSITPPPSTARKKKSWRVHVWLVDRGVRLPDVCEFNNLARQHETDGVSLVRYR